MMTLFAVVIALGVGLPTAVTSVTAQAARVDQAATAMAFPGQLAGVSATSSTEAWAAGSQSSGTLALHWNGTGWSKVPSPDPGPKGNHLLGVSAVSPTDAWAVGYYGNSTCAMAATLTLHWDGTAWSTVKSPDPGAACNYLEGVSAVSPTDAWAVGQSCTFAINTCHTLILHWNGTAWSKVASPNPGSGGFDPLASVSADSAIDAWAVGLYCTTSSCATRNTLILHWNGTAWSKVASPNPASGTYFLNSISPGSPASAWAVGDYCITSTCSTKNTLILHWNGTAWSKVTSPDPGPAMDSLNGVTALSPANAWAVGDYCTPRRCSVTNTLILHWNGTTWSTVVSPDPGTHNGLDAVSATTPRNAWAVGSTCVSVFGCRPSALILHWDGTTWSTASAKR